MATVVSTRLTNLYATSPRIAAAASTSFLELKSTALCFTFDGTGAASPASQSIVFTAVRHGIVTSTTWTATLYNNAGASLGAATLTGSGDTQTLTIANFGSAAYCVVTATADIFSSTLTAIRMKDGAVATAYSLVPSVAAMKQTQAGVFTPTTLTVSAVSQSGVAAPAAYSGRYKIYENGSGTAAYTSAADEASKVYTPSSSSVNSIKVELYLAGGVTAKIDEQTIPVVVDGVDALTAVLTNESFVFPAASNGAVATYGGSGTGIHVYCGTTELTYDGVGTSVGKWAVSTSSVNITRGSLAASAPYLIVGDHSGVANGTDTSTITYTITGKSVSGAAFTLVKTQTFTKARAGVDSTAYWLVASAAALQKAISGVFTPTTLTFSAMSQASASAPAAYSGRYKIYENGSGTAAYTSAADEASKVYTPSSSSVTSIKVELYLAGSTTTKLDEQLVPVVSDGAAGTAALTIVMGNDSCTLPADSAGNVSSYTNSGTTIQVYEGTTLLTYSTAALTASQFGIGTVAQSPVSTLTVGAISGNGTTLARVAAHSAMSAGTDSVNLTFPITVKRADGSSSTINYVQTITKSKAGAIGQTGQTGQTGQIGATGQSARRAFVVTTLASTPAVTAGSGDVVPTNSPTGVVAGKGWALTAYSTLAIGQFMYQVDGIYTPGGSIAWGNAYLSNLKVGSLSALAADLGAVSISTTGYLSTNGIGYGGTGVFLGYSGAYKFSVGDASNYLRWDGSTLTFQGNLSGTGTVDVSNYVRASGSVVSSGYYAAVTGIPSVASVNGVLGISSSGSGVIGWSNTGTGVSAYAPSGTALNCNGVMVKTGTELVANLNADMVDGLHVGNSANQIPLSNSTMCTGLYAQLTNYANFVWAGYASTTLKLTTTGPSVGGWSCSFNGANKPGNSYTSNVWLPVVINGTTYYIPVWQ